MWSVGAVYSQGNVVSYNPTGLPGQATYWQSLINTNTGIANTPGTNLTAWELVAPGAALPAIAGVTNPSGASGPAQWTWGKIVSLLNLISGTISGVAQVGTLTQGGGLSAAFNGSTSQTAASSAGSTVQSSAGTQTCYIGQNYSGCSPSSFAILSATVFPSSDKGLYYAATASPSFGAQVTITAYLYGSNSSPSSYNNGTLLGTTGLGTFNVNSNANLSALQTTAFSIASSNTSTAYEYVWVAIVVQDVAGNPTTFGYFYAAQVEFVNAAGAGASSTGVNVELLGPSLLYTQPIVTWRLGLFSNTTGWPTCGTFDSGRIWLGGAVVNRADACCSSGITTSTNGTTYNFAPTDQYGNVLDSSGISITIDLPEANPLQWMIPDQQGILVGTKAREALIFAPSAGGITPTNIDARKLTRLGGANIEPVQTEHTILFVQKFLRKIVEYFADVFSGKFTAPNLIQDAKQLTIGGLQEIAYQQELAPIAWARVDDELIGCTYKRDTLMTSSGPTMNGWHDHTLGSGRDVESIVTGSSVNGNLDALTVVTNDASTNIRFVEVLTDIIDEGALLSECSYLDAAITPTSTSAVAVGAGFPYGGLQLNGLWPLNGKIVSAWLGGLDCGDYTVSNGSIQVPYGDGIPNGGGAFPAATNRNDQGLFTAAFASTGITANGQTMWTGTMPMRVGFTYTSQAQLTRPMQPADTGARNGPAFAKLARDHYMMLQFEGSQGVSFGTAFDTTLLPVTFKQSDDQTQITIDQTFTGIFRDQPNHDYSFDAMPCWQVARPFPCNVAAVGAAQETADI